MLETLAHTPGAGRRLPIKLLLREASDEFFRGVVVGIKVRGKPDGPSGRACFLRGWHSEDYRRMRLTTQWRVRLLAAGLKPGLYRGGE